jgi:FkbM family methyltransferase
MFRKVIKDLTPPLIVSAFRGIFDGETREIQRLRELPRREESSTKILGPPTSIIDAASFLSDYKAIFEQEIYAFESDRRSPRIIDGGANIGLATLYWKRRFPEAQITAFEPSPDAFQALKDNVKSHGLEDVTLIQKGLWKTEGRISFEMDGADGGHFSEFPAENSVGRQEVPVTRLVPYLDQRIDMLKLDIEGAEVEVLLDAQGHLEQVRHLFVEYHSYPGEEQRIDEILTVLREAGFRIHLHPEGVDPQPFVEVSVYNGKDHAVNIFAYK